MAQTCELSSRNGSIVQFYDGRKLEALKSTDRITGSKHIFGSFDFLMTRCFLARPHVNQQTVSFPELNQSNHQSYKYVYAMA